MFCPKCGYKNPDEAAFCVQCGASMAQNTSQQQNNGDQNLNKSNNNIAGNSNNSGTETVIIDATNCCYYTKGARIMRLVVGIIAIVVQLFILLQSCAAGIVNSIFAPKTVAGSAGIIMCISMLTAGIISIAARKTKGGTITAAAFFMFGAVVCKIDVGLFKDLIVWSYISLIFAGLLIISLIMKEDKTYESRFVDVIVLGAIAVMVLIGMIAYDVTHKNTDGSEVVQVIDNGLNEMEAEVDKVFGDLSYDNFGYSETAAVTTSSVRQTTVVTTSTTTATTEYVDPNVSLNMLGTYTTYQTDLYAELDKIGDSFTIVFHHKLTDYYCAASGKIDKKGHWNGNAVNIFKYDNGKSSTYDHSGTENISLTFMPSDDAFILKEDGQEFEYSISKPSYISIPINSFVNIDDGYLNVRDAAGLDGKVIGKLHKNDKVIVVDKVNGNDGNWALVVYDRNNIGFVSEDFISDKVKRT